MSQIKNKRSILLLLVLMVAAFCPASAQMPQSPSQVIESLIMSRRSIRKFTERSISRDTLDIIMNSGINAPNGQNRQAYEIRVVDNPAILDKISQAAHSGVSTGMSAAGNAPGNLFYGAPCVVFIANDTGYDMSQVDCGLFGENIILTAWSMGIGSCCMAGPIRQMKESETCAPLIQKMGFSEGYNLLYCIVLGYPDESPTAKPRMTEKFRYFDNAL